MWLQTDSLVKRRNRLFKVIPPSAPLSSLSLSNTRTHRHTHSLFVITAVRVCALRASVTG